MTEADQVSMKGQTDMAGGQLHAELAEKARQIRIASLRMIHHARSGHPGGSLSMADMLAVLYWHILHIDPEQTDWPERDRFVLSKGHACPALYATLALRGYFPVEELKTLRAINSRLQGHPDMLKTPGLDMTSGSLGQGLSAAVGMALGARHLGHPFRVFAMLSCGEQDEGQTWEAGMCAAHYGLGNLVMLLDYNQLQLDGWNHEVMGTAPLQEKWRAFGWEVIEIDGHNMPEIVTGIEAACRVQDRPTVVFAHTVKGKGVSFMENQCDWHGRVPDDAQLAQALDELGAS